MKLNTLYNLAATFNEHKRLHHIGRLRDTLLVMKLDNTCYGLDLNKGSPRVFLMEDDIRANAYKAPFDIALDRYCCKARLGGCRLDGLNKILIFQCITKKSYKEEEVWLHIEFISRATNVLLVKDGLLLSALSFSTSPRLIQARMPFSPMPQPSFSKELKLEDKETFLKRLKEELDLKLEAELGKKRANLLARLQSQLDRLRGIYEGLPKLDSLEAQREESSMLANYLLSHINEIKPYANSLSIEGKSYEIPSQSRPALSAQILFKQAKKLKQKAQNLGLQKENLESKIDFLQNQMEFARRASLEELEILSHREVGRKKQGKKRFESFYIDGVKVSMGRNETENASLLQTAKADFVWLHVRERPSSHMIIHASKPESRIIEKAGMILAALNGEKGRVWIDYTKRRFVRIRQGASVVYSKEKTLQLQVTS